MTDLSADGTTPAATQRTIGFLNLAHAIDHFALLIFPTVVIGLESVYGRSYGELIALSTAAFVAFGVFSLPAGWLADRWSRRRMMGVFYIGIGISLAAVGAAPNLFVLALAMFAVGVCAAIYHPVGMAMLIDVSQARGRTLAFNGVCGNLGVALAAAISAALASWLGWRFAFYIPAVICIVSGIAFLRLTPGDTHHIGARKTKAEVPLSAGAAATMLGLYVVISIAGGFVFNTVLIALPKIVDERIGDNAPLILVGSIATMIFLCGAAAQIASGRLIERYAPHWMFVGVVALQLAGILWAANATGLALVAALAVAMAGIYGQVTTGDIVLARYTADAWRGRIYAVRYFLTFMSAGVSVAAIAWMHGRGGFDLVLAVVSIAAIVLLVAVVGFALLVSGAEARHRASVVPAE